MQRPILKEESFRQFLNLALARTAVSDGETQMQHQNRIPAGLLRIGPCSAPCFRFLCSPRAIFGWVEVQSASRSIHREH